MLHRVVVEPSEKCMTSIAFLSLYRRSQSVDCSDRDENEDDCDLEHVRSRACNAYIE